MYYVYIDEAWRWPLAWPVYVWLIIEKTKNTTTVRNVIDNFPANNLSLYTWYKDSKVLSESQRNVLYSQIVAQKEIQFSSAKISASEIDKKWIIWCLRNAILRALHAYFVWGKYTLLSLRARLEKNSHALTLVVDWPSDFWLRKALWVTVVPIVNGDALVPMISAASIIAKVERDAYMYRAHKRFPAYDFHLHKWYGTKAHYEAIRENGLCKEHRVSYIH